MLNWRRLFCGRGLRVAGVLTPELRKRIRLSFDEDSRDEELFPSTIDPCSPPVRLILDYFGDLANKRIVDVGCGKGRFARALLDRHPDAQIWGVDPSEQMLRHAPTGVHRVVSFMTEMPFETATFDAAYATESIEHAVEIERAVSEICRIVKPGGRVLIIDKNSDFFGCLPTPDWERWFTREEIQALLARHCSKLSCSAVSYRQDVNPDGLFLAWLCEVKGE